jgi:conjugal transfer pilus assembly protein TraF
VTKDNLTVLMLVLLLGNDPAFAQEAEQDQAAFYGVSDGRWQPTFVSASSPYYEDKERGWFWYEEPVVEDQEVIESQNEPASPKAPAQEKKPKPKPQAKSAGAKPLSSEWFRKNIEKFRDKAIDEPTPENVKLYLYLQRVMMDKAEKFAHASQVAVMSDPVLDENSRRPIATFGSFAKDEMATRGTQKAARKLAKSAGLWFFYLSTCEYCLKETGVLQGLMNTYGFKVLPIALDGLPLPNGEFPNFTIDEGQAKKMGVESTPALFLVKPGDNGSVIQLGQGLLSGEEIVNRAITLSHQQGWITADEYEDTRKVKTIEVDNKTINGIDERTLNNPTELINTIRSNLKMQL